MDGTPDQCDTDAQRRFRRERKPVRGHSNSSTSRQIDIRQRQRAFEAEARASTVKAFPKKDFAARGAAIRHQLEAERVNAGRQRA